MVDKKEWTDATLEKIAAYSPNLIKRLKRFTPHPQDAEDAAQEAIHKALIASREGHLDEPKNVPAYMVTIGKRVLMTEARKETLPTGKSRIMSLPDSEAYERFFNNLRDKGNDPVVSLQAKEILDRFQRLPRSHKEVFLMRYVDGYSIEEIAGITTMPEATVKTTLFRVREDLKKELDTPTGQISR